MSGNPTPPQRKTQRVASLFTDDTDENAEKYCRNTVETLILAYMQRILARSQQSQTSRISNAPAEGSEHPQ